MAKAAGSEEATGADPEGGQVDAAGRHAGHGRAGGAKERRRRQGQGRGRAGRRGHRRLRGPRRAGRGRRRRAGGQPRDRPGRRGQTAATAARPTSPRRSRPGAGRTSPSGPPRRSSRTRSRCSGPGWPSTPCCRCSRRSSPGCRSTGWSPTPATVADQINQLTDRCCRQRRPRSSGPQLKQVTSGAGGALGVATVIGILTALWSASSGMKAMITGVNLAYDETEGRKFVKLRGLSIALTLGAMVLMAVALALIVGFPALADSWPTALRWTVGILRWVLLAALLIAALAVSTGSRRPYRRPGRALPLRPRPRRAQVDLGQLGLGDRHPAVDPGLDRLLHLRQLLRQLQQDLRGPGRGHHPDVLAVPDGGDRARRGRAEHRDGAPDGQGHHRRPDEADGGPRRPRRRPRRRVPGSRSR